MNSILRIKFSKILCGESDKSLGVGFCTSGFWFMGFGIVCCEVGGWDTLRIYGRLRVES